jgi:hypothetical protein
MAVFNGLDLGAFRWQLQSGATSGATFAVTGLTAADKAVGGAVFAGGASHTMKSAINPSELTFSAGAACTNAVDTDADTVLVVWMDVSAL